MPILTNPDLIFFSSELRGLASELRGVRPEELTRLGCDYREGYLAACRCPDHLREAAMKLRAAGFEPDFSDRLDAFAVEFELACVEPMFGEGSGPSPEHYQSWLAAVVDALLAAARPMDQAADIGIELLQRRLDVSYPSVSSVGS